MLWPESSEAQARTNLRQLIHHLRRALPTDCSLFVADNQTVCWKLDDSCSVDVIEFEEAISASTREGLEEAVRLYQDDLLPDLYDEWLLEVREKFRLKFEEAVERLAGLCEEQGDRAAAIGYATRLVALDPLRESSYYRLMQLHLRNGDRASAARIYHQCVRNLKRELGIDPGSEIRELLERATVPDLPSNGAAVVSYAPAAPIQLVGRAREWNELLECWRLAGAGRAQMAIVLGEAGIGKSRLANELFDACSREGEAAARARCYVTQSGLAYTPVTDWLRAEPFRSGREKLPKSQLTELSRVLPEILAEHPEIAPPQPLSESWQRRHFYDALDAAVANAPKPLLLLVDDLQWCDRDSLDWLHVLFRSGAAEGTLLLATARPEEMGRDHPATGLARELRAMGQLSEIRLAPLSPSETATLAAHIASRDCEPAFANDLYSSTRGNPLFIVESVRMALEGREPAGRTPSHVQAVIASRLAQLSSSAYELAGLIAAIGRPASYELLAQTTDWDDASLSGALEELWQRRIVDAKDDRAYDYTHDLLRDVAYSELNPIRKRSLHRRVAASLERLYATDPDAPTGEIAAHYEAAGMPEQAIAWYQRAASNARRRFADGEGVDAIHRALALCRSLPATAKRDATEIELLTQLGPSLAATQGYSMPEVGETYDRGLMLCERTGHREHLFSLMSGAWVYRTVRGDLTGALEMANRYLKDADVENEPALRMTGEFVSGAIKFHLGDFQASAQHLQRALALSGSASHPALALFAGPDVGVFCRVYVPHVLWHLGDTEGAAAKSDEAVALARGRSNPFSLAIALSYASMSAVFARQTDVASERAEQAYAICEKHGFKYYRAFAEILAGWADCKLGRVERGLTRLREGLESLKSMQAELRLPFYYRLLAEACGLAGRPDEALANVATGLAFASKNGEKWPVPELQRIHRELQRSQNALRTPSAPY